MKSITYLGTADDVVKRYPWSRRNDLENIEDQLLHAAIYDQQIALNDGYLIANDDLHSALVNLNKSLLGSLILSEIVIVFCRAEPANLVEGLERRAQAINTHRRILKSADWPAIREDLEILQRNISSTAIRWPIDKNMGAIFYKAMSILHTEDKGRFAMRESSREDFEAIFRRFDDDLDKRSYDGARSLWETCCWIHFSRTPVDPMATDIEKHAGYNKVKEMMQLANEAYHVAYSSALSHSLRTDQNPTVHTVRPLTAVCPAYGNLLRRETFEAQEALRLDRFDQLLLTTRKLRFREDSHYGWLQDLHYDRDLRGLRREYVEMLDAYIHDRFEFDKAIALRDQYASSLAKLAAPYLNKPLGHTELLVNAAANYIAGFKGPLAGLLLSYFVDKKGNTIYEKLLTGPAIENGLKEDGIRATQELSAGMLARDLGLIGAELDTRSVDSFVEDIKPHPTASSKRGR